MSQASTVGPCGANKAGPPWRLVEAKRWLTAFFCVSVPVHAGDFIFFDSFEVALHPVAGSVIVTEVMSNPVLVADAAGEWFEMANVADQSIDLGGCVVSQSALQATLPAYVMPPAGFAVAARSTDMSSNGNVAAFAVFNFGLGASGALELHCDGRLIDAVTWSGESPGHSSNLRPQNFDAVANDNWILNWCFTTTSYNGTDTGTPNAANENCPSG